MYSTFSSTPKLPSAPQSTPSSISLVSSRSKILKAPIHNPYDKFTQPQFDAWIGDITGALRRALGHEDEPEDKADNSTTQSHDRHELDVSESESNVLETDEEVDDSLADIRMKRSIGKGKARDPREGPGLGPGTLDEPIELDLDSDAEEESGSEESYEEGSGEEDGSDEEEAGIFEHDRVTRLDGRRAHTARESEEEDSGEEAGYEEYDEEDHNPELDRHTEKQEDEEAIEISDGEEEEENDENRQPSVKVEEIGSEEEDYEDVEEDDIAVLERKHHPLFVSNEDVARGAEDDDVIEEDHQEGESGKAPHVMDHHDDVLEEEEVYEVGELEEMQPSEDNTAFPVQATHDPSSALQPVNISDPWAGPQTYAEDFYSGGTVRLDPAFPASADNLNELDVGSDIGTFLTPGVITPNSADNLSIAAADVAFQSSFPAFSPTPQQSISQRSEPEVINVLDDEEEVQEEEDEHYHPASSPLPGSSPPATYFEPGSRVSPGDMAFMKELYGDLEVDLEDQSYSNDNQPHAPLSNDDGKTADNSLSLPIDSEENDEVRREEPKAVEDDEEEEDEEEDEIDELEIPLGTSDLDFMDTKEDEKSADITEVEDEPANASIPEVLTGLSVPAENIHVDDEFSRAPEVIPAGHAVEQSDVDDEIHFEYIPPDETKDEDEPTEDIEIDLVSPTTVHTEHPDPREDFEVEENSMPPQYTDPEYTVDEVFTEDEFDINHDADHDFDVESVPGPVAEDTHQPYEVEEVMTEGRLTIEPVDREPSLDVISVDAEDPSGHADSEEDGISKPVDLPQSRVAEVVEAAVSVDTPAVDDGIAVPEEVVEIPGSENIPSTTLDVPALLAHLTTDLQPTSDIEVVVHDMTVSTSPVDDTEDKVETDIPLQPPQEIAPLDSLERLTPDSAVIHATVPSESADVSVAVSENFDSAVSPDLLLSDPVPMEEDASNQNEAPAPSLFDEISDHTPPSSAAHTIPEPISELLPDAMRPSLSVEPSVSEYSISVPAVGASLEKVDEVPEPKSSLAHRAPSTSEVVLTRKSSLPVLYSDPYPASLSTPGIDHENDDEESTDEEPSRDEEGDTSVSSTTDEEKHEVQPTELENMSVDLDLELQYPSAMENLSPSVDDNAEPEDGDDSDAEGDLDPDFIVDADGLVTPATSARADSLGNEEFAEDVTEPSHVASSVDKSELQESSTIPRSETSNEPTSQILGLPAVPEPEMSATSAESVSSPPKADEVTKAHPESPHAMESVESLTQIVDELSQSNAAQPTPDVDKAELPEGFQAERNVKESVDTVANGVMDHGEDDVVNGVADHGKDTVVNGAVDHEKNSAAQPHFSLSNDKEAATTELSSNEAVDNTPTPPLQQQQQPPGSTEAEVAKSDEKDDGISDGASRNTRRSKRKRKAPTRLLETSLSAKQLSKKSSISSDTKGKGKGRQKRTLRQASTTPSSSSASSAAKLLQPGSRASSIVSTSTGDGSAVTQPSPTVARLQAGLTGPPPPPPPPPPQFMPQLMFHNHGRPRPPPPQNRPSLSLQTQVQKQIPRAPSLPRPNASQHHSPVAPVAGPSSQPSPSPQAVIQATSVHREGPLSNSPVTRSHCRYHKISLPEEEDDGPHIFFLVPGCSLVNRKLMREEDIVDHGDATYEDSLRKVDDIETLGINEYVIGIMRLLVGPDKEHEVYFLPKPGEERARKVVLRRSTLSRSSWKDLSATGVAGSPRASNGNIFSPTSSRAPLSVAGSTSTNKSSKPRPPDDGVDSESLSSFTDTETDGSDEEHDDSPDSKRPKLASQGEDGNVPQPLQVTQSIGSSTKRIRRLPPDAAAYKPEEDDSGEESTDDSPKRKKHSQKKSLKRARTSEVGTGGGEDIERKLKKSKTSRSTLIPYPGP